MGKREEVMTLLKECVQEYSEQSGQELAIQEDTPLIGPEATVDSLGLVMVITSFEAQLNDKYGTELVLANEKAMSMRNSPFRSLNALTDYAVSLLDEAGAAA
ncbi:hypothetical protein NG895_13695 [Aeoliella sp. ICT_H6.2]|uniref:Carrier domain-containing protein n=1 Tax=Aeoliella straminimaris TaxID=2954799 RepID=A0A9X2FB22_9BACT|nr:hypothetical protein [Aeoliella straminimaris]MCO6044958.1 hypothetical protein [Aeoliella straminimaris]